MCGNRKFSVGGMRGRRDARPAGRRIRNTRMNIIDSFAQYLSKEVEKNPEAARRLLFFGWRSYLTYMKLRPDRKLPPSRRYLERTVMGEVLDAFSDPGHSCMCSLFVPGEPLAAAGIHPYSVEALSAFLAGTHVENVFTNVTGDKGVPETMCSFHRVFLGAAESDLMPRPPFLIYTNLACDGNMITFPYLKQRFQVPAFFIDVPWERSLESVDYVADELRRMTAFLSEQTGKTITGEMLREAVSRSNRASSSYEKCLDLMRSRQIRTGMTAEMYGIFVSRILSGSKISERYARLLLRDLTAAGPMHAVKLVWIHVMPFMQPSLRALLNDSDSVCTVASDIVSDGFRVVDSGDPYRGMAERMVYSAFNGSTTARADYALSLAKRTGADGAVIFSHWGCKTTIGASGLIKEALETEHIPALILDGDACCPGNTADGQIRTRMQAFLEMLEERKGAEKA